MSIIIIVTIPESYANAANLGSTYYFSNSFLGGQADQTIAFGRSTDDVFVGDWNGDGADTLAVRRGNTYYIKNSISGGQADKTVAYGKSTDDVLVGDWNGDGADTLAVRRGNTYYIKNSISGGKADRTISYGKATDYVLVGDWNGDGTDTLAVRRGNTYYIKNSISGGKADETVGYGKATDYVLIGDWNGDSTDTLAVRRGNTYYLKNSLAGGQADITFAYGKATDYVLVGDWNADGNDTLAVRRHPISSNSTSSNSNAANISDYVSDQAPTEITFNSSTADDLGPGWASNSVNATSFRQSSIVTRTNAAGHDIQTVAFYDQSGRIVLARRDATLGTTWLKSTTQYSGNLLDAHNVISLGMDGSGYLHLAWGVHSGKLQYAKSASPWSLNLGNQQSPTGKNENHATYPQFFTQSNGNMFLLYRDGGSGNGNLVLDRYDASSATWKQLNSDLIDGVSGGSGSSHSSPYWQAVLDSRDRLQISWVWRDSGDVSTNHDLNYARSTDATGNTWENSQGRAYSGAITQQNAERIVEISQNRQLMNQTSMTVDANDHPYIVSYWDPDGSRIVVQYMVFHQNDDGSWTSENTGIRTTFFDLQGAGSKAVPIARPQIAVSGSGNTARVHLIIRDEERGSGASLASETEGTGAWEIVNLTNQALDYWEPTYDTSLWLTKNKLDIFVQKVGQVDAEGVATYPAEHVYVLHVDDNVLR